MTEKEILLNGLTHYLGDCEKCDSCPYHDNPECMKDMVKDCVDYLLGSEKSEPAPPDLLPCIAYTTPDLRPCIVKGEKVYFHQWANWQDADNLLYPVAIVEKEDGRCSCVDITDIKFTDRETEKND